MRTKIYVTITLAAIAFAVGFTFYNVFKTEDVLLREHVRALAQSRSCNCEVCNPGYYVVDGCCVPVDRGSAVRSGNCSRCEKGYLLLDGQCITAGACLVYSPSMFGTPYFGEECNSPCEGIFAIICDLGPGPSCRDAYCWTK